ncbi:MAG: LysR family transcriptional regulator [Pseudomonadota bacterium]
MDHFTALRVFRSVVEAGSFAAAARELGLSNAAVSKNVGELEAHLGARLLNRTTRSMSLTEAGSLYYDRVSQVLDELADADAALGPLQQAPTGLLRVSAPMTLTLLKLSEAIPRFLAEHPQVQLDLQMDDRRVNIIEDGFDLAIRGSDNLEDSSLVARKLMVLDHVVCAAPSYLESAGRPVRPEDLEHHNCVQFTLSGHASEWQFTRADQSVRVQVSGSYKVTSSLAVRDALLSGLGLSLIPRTYVSQQIERGELYTVLDDWDPVETSIYAVYPSRRYLMAKVRAFIDFLVAELSDNSA